MSDTQKTPEQIAAEAAKATAAAEAEKKAADDKAKADAAAEKKAEGKKAGKWTVLCVLENASNNINGIAFETVTDGVEAKGLTADEAAMFKGIPGYTISEG